MDPDPQPDRRFWHSLPFIAGTAVVLRLVAVHFLYRDTWNSFEDHLLFGFEIGRIARSIASGHGYSSPMLPETGPTAWVTPVYPCLLAVVFKFFGIYTKASALVILGFNAVVSGLVCLPVYFAARRSFGRETAVVACWIWILWPYSIYIAGSFVWETCLAALLLALLFAYALVLHESSGQRAWLAYGGLGGLAALTNAALATLPLALGLYALRPLWRERRRYWVSALLLLSGFVVVLLPWQVRNYRTFHQFIPLRDTFWLEMRVGNSGSMEAWFDDDAHPSLNRGQLSEFVRAGELPYMREKKREVLSFLGEHPLFYIVVSARRVLYMWTGFWNLQPNNRDSEFHGADNVYLGVLLFVLTLKGIAVAMRRARAKLAPYLIVFLVYPIPFYLTHPEVRYRHVMEPEMIILAALGLRFLVSEAVLAFRRRPALTAGWRAEARPG